MAYQEFLIKFPDEKTIRGIIIHLGLFSPKAGLVFENADILLLTGLKF